MRKVARQEIVDFETYGDQRDAIREQVFATKALRRIHVGPNVTFLFENQETVRYQIQEMIRVERIIREADIQHEIDTYNELIGDEGGIGATVLIEIADEAERREKLKQWSTLYDNLYVELYNEKKVYCQSDERQHASDKISSVLYVKFACEGKEIVACGVDHPGYDHHVELSAEQRAALLADIAS